MATGSYLFRGTVVPYSDGPLPGYVSNPDGPGYVQLGGAAPLAEASVYIAFPFPVQAPGDVIRGLLSWLGSITVGGATVLAPAPQPAPITPSDTEPTTAVPAGPSAAAQAIIDTITERAKHYGLDPLLALATAIHESGLNNQAIGDGGTSFGLFQLHRGGELGNLTPQAAFDPFTNADVALGTMAGFAAAGHYTTPGALAAAAQRPFDPIGYAAAINGLYSQLRAGTLPLR